MKPTLLNRIKALEKEDLKGLPFKLSAYSKEERSFVLEQLNCRKIAQKKLPTYYAADCLYTKRALEQCSSEKAATFKAGLISGDFLLDLCGGLGVDDYWFAQQFDQVHSLDTDSRLNELVVFNNEQLNCKNHSRITQSAEDVSRDLAQKADWIYLDPDRRDGTTRSFDLRNHSPNLLELLKLYPKKKFLAKLSPMADINWIRANVPGASSIYVVSVNYENKEILVEVNPDAQQKVVAVELQQDKLLYTSKSTETEPQVMDASEEILLLPSPALIKANLVLAYAAEHSLSMASYKAPFLFSATVLNDFPGKQYQIQEALPYQPEKLRNHLKTRGIAKAHVLARNFHLKSTEAQQALGLKEGEDAHLFCTLNSENKGWVFICQPLAPEQGQLLPR